MQRYPDQFEPAARVMKAKAKEAGLDLRILRDQDGGSGFYLHFQGRRPTDQEKEWIGTETMKVVGNGQAPD